MKKIMLALYCLTFLLFGCSKLDKITSELKTREFTITEGSGFYKYRIDSTNIRDVIQDFGKKYKKIKHEDFCTEIIYEKYGLSFCYDLEDSLQRVVSIEFFYPFRGITSRGIVLNKSTMIDVKNAHDSLDWYSTENSKYWVSEYTGIEYSVEREMSLPQFPLNEELHSKRIIIRIEIVNNDSE